MPAEQGEQSLCQSCETGRSKGSFTATFGAALTSCSQLPTAGQRALPLTVLGNCPHVMIKPDM